MQRADALKLSESQEWRHQLFYVNRFLRFDSSTVDSDDFFISPVGKTDAREELRATIKSFYAESQTGGNSDSKAGQGMLTAKSALCRYPQRLDWLRSKLGTGLFKLPSPCADYEKWRAEHPVRAISLVFASNYLANPASLFGHTFFRLHRDPYSPGHDHSALLDDALNFAANPTTENPLLYTVAGLSGQFRGVFSLMPYFYKVQEYNNSENRDLWEYELEFSQDDVDRLMKVIWEVGPHHVNYFYFDENCSYVLLQVLQVVKPKWDLVDRVGPFVLPSDTLKIAVANPERRRNVSYRPSSLTRLRDSYSKLNDREKEIVQEVFQSNKLSQKDFLDSSTQTPVAPASQAKVLDTLIEKIDFSEKLYGDKALKEFGELRKAALTSRSRMREPPGSVTRLESEAPHQGHFGQAVGLRGVQNDGKNRVDVGARFSLHEMTTPSLGYSSSIHLAMAEMWFRQETSEGREARFTPDFYRLFEVKSLPHYNWAYPSPSWMMSVAGQRQGVGESHCFEHVLKGGVGIANDIWKVKIYGLPYGGVSTVCAKQSFKLLSGLELGVLSELTSTFKLAFSAKSEWSHLAKKESSFAEFLEASLSYLSSARLELRVDYRRFVKSQELSFGGLWYF